VCLRNADERSRLSLAQALAEIAHSHARIDQDRHRSDLEESEGQGKEFKARLHHQHSAHTPADADLLQAAGENVAFVVQLAKREMGVADPTLAIAALRKDDGQGVRLPPGHLLQVGGDVHHICRM
jgi:hypothetical protein